MSKEALSEFLQKVNTDESLKNALQAKFDDASEIPSQDLVAFAEEQGYQFTVDDAKDALSDAELEGVSGGTLSWPSKWYTETDSSLTYSLSYDMDSDAFTFEEIKFG
ncbi:MAG: Nif11-like leader peptide family RiPP precursor [Longimicrobiales bacterium]|nr:Nif11-like leader peptide family RiPP precursor [Longimicrobiales bacterium]